MESTRSSAQTMTTASSNIVETFVYVPFVEDSERRIDLLVQKTVVHNLLRIPQSTFPFYRPQFKWNKPVLLPKQ